MSNHECMATHECMRAWQPMPGPLCIFRARIHGRSNEEDTQMSTEEDTQMSTYFLLSHLTTVKYVLLSDWTTAYLATSWGVG